MLDLMCVCFCVFFLYSADRKDLSDEEDVRQVVADRLKQDVVSICIQVMYYVFTYICPHKPVLEKSSDHLWLIAGRSVILGSDMLKLPV